MENFINGFDPKHFFKILIITIIITLIVIFIIVLFRLHNAVDYNFRKFPRDKIHKHLKTGDLIGISYPSLRGKLVKVFTGSSWAHVGMIIEMKGKGPCVLEMGRYSRCKRGVLIHPIEEWLEFNDEKLITWRPYHGSLAPSDRLKLEQFLEKHKHKREDMFIVSWLKSMVKMSYTPNKVKNEYYCSEFIAHLLQEIGIIRKDCDPSGYCPQELLSGNLPLLGQHRYEQPYLLV